MNRAVFGTFNNNVGTFNNNNIMIIIIIIRRRRRRRGRRKKNIFIAHLSSNDLGA